MLLLVVLPLLAGVGLWASRARSRAALGSAAVASLAVTLGVAVWAAWTQPHLVLRWGSGLDLVLEVSDIARAPVVLVAFVALPIVGYAAAHEDERGLARMVGLLVAFVGAMQLLLLAGDLLTLLIGWELVGAASWALIAHEWRTAAPSGAAGAFNTTRFGDLGLFVAAGAAFAGTGSLAFGDLAGLNGGLAGAFVAGVLLAALAKSAQVPFSPWLFSAMAGPTPASALLHSATMVAAGAYLLARLQPVLDTVAWFAPTAIGVGLVTALAGGVVAAIQTDAKKLLAASTSAQYGLMIVAVGAGYPTVAIVHLVAHGLYKTLLFLSAGVAISASGRHDLPGMGLGRELRATAWVTASGAAALAAVPPLGAAWTKEEIVAAASHAAPWLGVLVIVAGGLSAFYAARFQLLAYGPPRERHHPLVARPGHVELAALAVLGATGIALGVLWLPFGQRALLTVTGGELPPGAVWEVAASLGAVAISVYAAVVLLRRGRLAHLAASSPTRAVADWFAIPAATRVGVVTPTLALAHAAARFDDVIIDGAVRGVATVGRRAAGVLGRGDDRVVDAGVRAVAAVTVWTAGVLDRVAELAVDGAIEGFARLVGAAGRDSRRLQTGQAHTYYAAIAVGTVVLVALTAVWSR
ncbi:NADH-quinone oxidoreductase subunit L [soil metagenome]